LVVFFPGLLIAALAWGRGRPWYICLGWFVFAGMWPVLAMAAGIQGCRLCDPLDAAVDGLLLYSWGLLGPLAVALIYAVTRLLAWAAPRWRDSRLRSDAAPQLSKIRPAASDLPGVDREENPAFETWPKRP
jgi:hypothetical protein